MEISLNRQTVLAQDELPDQIDIHGQCLTMRKLCNQPGLLSTDITSTLLQECYYSDFTDRGNGAIIFISGRLQFFSNIVLVFFLFDSPQLELQMVVFPQMEYQFFFSSSLW